METMTCRLASQGISQLRPTSSHSIAVESGGLTLTHQELDLRADRFAGYLVQSGVLPGGTVALCLERSFEWIIAALGIMRAGAAYVPLDPAWPDSRLRFAIENCGATILVAPVDLFDRLKSKVDHIDPRRDAAAITVAPLLPKRPISPESLAYVIYTSGSTGVPKGVEITHANLSHLISWHQKAFGITQGDRASHLASLGFDAAVWDVWPNLCGGATLCLPEDSVRLSAELIQAWILRERITIGFVPTVHAAPLMTMQWPATTALRFLLTGGDTLHHMPPASLPFKVVNNYGPTECTVVATSSLLQAGTGEAPPIGGPISGAAVYLLDEAGAPVPQGHMGEIWIGGNGVGRGYRNLHAATLRCFARDPFSKVKDARMYRTGDFGVRRVDGEIDFRGRVDRQVKIRGQRVELDEIASLLSQFPGVHFATAIVSTIKMEDQLVAYVLPGDERCVPAVRDLQEHLLRHLPQYMIPTVFVRLSSLPLSPNGKVDLAMLPKPADAPLLERDVISQPSTPLQDNILRLVRELLKSDTIAAEDNFFLAGGHSLLGMQLIMRLRSEFGVDLTLRQLFEAPTVKDLALFVERKLVQTRLSAIWTNLLNVNDLDSNMTFSGLGGDEILIEELQRRIQAEFGRQVMKHELTCKQTVSEQTELICSSPENKLALPRGVVALQPRGNRNGLYWLHYPCPILAKAMGEERPFLYVTLIDEDLAALGEAPTLREIAMRLVSKILAAQPEGPYTLGGFCLGGMLSYEVACQLEAAGREVSMLIMVDTPSPKHFRRAAQMLALLGKPGYLFKRFVELGVRDSLTNIMGRASRVLPGEAKMLAQEGEPLQVMIETAAHRYCPSRYQGKASLIMASDISPELPPSTSFLPWWQSLLHENLHTEYVKGQHYDLIDEPAVQGLAHAIRSHLLCAEQRSDERIPQVPISSLSGEEYASRNFRAAALSGAVRS